MRRGRYALPHFVMAADTEGTERKPRRSWRKIAAAVLLALVVFACVGSAAVLLVMDRTTAAGMVYLNAVSSGNTWAAEALGDHWSADQAQNMSFYEADIQRDTAWLRGAEITDATATREQTLSGQWVTMVRFNWRPTGSLDPPKKGALRVKTDSWLIVTYVRAVEVTDP